MSYQASLGNLQVDPQAARDVKARIVVARQKLVEGHDKFMQGEKDFNNSTELRWGDAHHQAVSSFSGSNFENDIANIIAAEDNLERAAAAAETVSNTDYQ